MLEEGVMHADPHGGNLLRARPRDDDEAAAGTIIARPRALARKLLRRPPPRKKKSPLSAEIARTFSADL